MCRSNWLTKLLFLYLLISTLTISAIAAENTTEFAGGEGTEASPYLIANVTHLNNVRNYLDANFKMTADIAFSEADADWISIGTEKTPFTGTFNGDGHTITGLNQNISASAITYNGLFGYVEEASIMNLGMRAVDINVTATSKSHTGSIAGYANSSAISNCYSTGKVSITNTSQNITYAFAGGNVGYSWFCTISDCYNTAEVIATALGEYAYAEAGGIAGYASMETTIRNCYNMGKVSASSANYAYAGGITGNLDIESSVSASRNAEAISATASSKEVHAYAGGISGVVKESSSISESHNTGVLSGRYAGGIVGYILSGTVSKSSNDGEVNVSSPSARYKPYAGGIAGYSSGCISLCCNMGKVSTLSSNAFIGGIAGYAVNSSPAISNCYNTGQVSAPDANFGILYAGGIVGFFKECAISNCYNASEVSASVSNLHEGGIAGYVGDGGTVDNCYYWDGCSTGVGNGVGSTTKCTAAQMTQQATFVGFDFIETWTMVGSKDYSYPELQAFAKDELAFIDIVSVSANSVELSFAINEAGICYVAIYNNEGRMLSCSLTEVKASAGNLTVSIVPGLTDSLCTVKAFLVNPQGIPACPCAIP